MAKRALISVSDKRGIGELGKALAAQGYEIISTGNTAKALEKEGLTTIGVEAVTGFPECLDGRVKTLHPNLFAGILAIRESDAHMNTLKEHDISAIDLVVVNLYPFAQTIARPDATLEEAIENIDIGGPSLIRAAAKNHRSGVTVLVDPDDYIKVIDELQGGGVSDATRFYLAAKVFEHTAHYDTLIAGYLRKKAGLGEFPQVLNLTYEKVSEMRYGENPHQSAAFYKEFGDLTGFLPSAVQLHGKELSYNNINDANGALALLKEYDEPTVVACKHANPCGVGSGESLYEAYQKAYTCDPVSIFGGIIVCNRELGADIAEELNKIFVEIIAAPSFTEDALLALKKKKNIRILQIDDIAKKEPIGTWDMKKVSGGLLVQGIDSVLLPEGDCRVVTDRAPTDKEWADLMFAWKMVKHVKSNGIAIGKNGQSIGIGPGQVNRIWACKQAIEHGIESLGKESLQGAALASDAFFPFPDCAEAAAAAGITAIIQPGGSVNDDKSIECCNRYGIAMVFTEMRHFKH